MEGRHMKQTTVFRSNRSQAVRLPKDVALPEGVRQVDVLCVGSARLIVPTGRRWDDFFAGPRVSADFMEMRDQPGIQQRADW
jgi:antitoxin VapB